MAFCREVITNRFITLQHIGKVVDIKKKREIHNTDKTVGGVEPTPQKRGNRRITAMVLPPSFHKSQ